MRVIIAAIAFVLMATVTIGCGQNQATLSPVGPSALPRTSLGATSGTSGTQAIGASSLIGPAAATTVTGTITAVTGACPTLALTIGAATVATDATTVITGGACTDLIAGRAVTVNAVAQADGSLKASSITLTTGGQNPAEMVDVDGTVASVQGACPVVTFLVAGQHIVVDATTMFVGGTCASLAPGRRVSLEGRRGDQGVIVAVRVQFKSADDGDGTDDTMHVSGTVGVAPTGLCPAVTFVVGTQTVKTTAATNFAGGSCALIVAGASVEVEGTLGADGAVMAYMVEVEDDEDAEVPNTQMSGHVSALKGACPLRTFNLKGFDVSTSAATTFTGGSCADLRPGVEVEIRGTRVGERAVLASEISISGKANDDPTPAPTPTPPAPPKPPTPTPTTDVEVSGTVGSLSGACPALSFQVSGSSVRTTAATRFEHGSCGDLRAGVRVEVKGTRTGNGPITATRVSIQRK